MDRTQTLIASAFALALAHSAVSAAEKPVDFAREILPVLSNKCFVCHGPDSRKEDLLRLDSFEGATSDLGGYRAVDPGDLAKSEIIARIHDTDDPMPPEDSGKQLTPAERKLIERWALQGGGYSMHWAFIPPAKPDTPEVANSAWPRGEIDRFVLAKLEANNLSPVRDAHRQVCAKWIHFYEPCKQQFSGGGRDAAEKS